MLEFKNISSENEDRLLFWYIFLSVFNKVIFFFNISMYLFPLLLFNYRRKYGYMLRYESYTQLIALIFGGAAILSTLSTTIHLEKGNFFSSLTVLPNYLYWSFILLFFISHRKNINLNISIKSISYGLFFTIVYHYLLIFLNLNNFPGLVGSSQNGFAFKMIIFSPIALYFFYTRKGFAKTVFAALLLIYVAIVSGSRSGTGIVLISNIMILMYIYSNERRTLFIATFIPIIFSGIIFFNSNYFWDIIYDINPRFYNIVLEKSNILTNDTSFLFRRAQVEKGLEVFDKYPFLGIGLNNFQSYYIYQPLNFEGSHWIAAKDQVFNASAHNSYINILAEGGLLLFIPFSTLLFLPIFRILIKIIRLNEFTIQFVFFVSFISMAIHLYFISAILNMYAWVLIALGLVVSDSRYKY